jgi:periplasmic protein TonB
MRSMLLAQGRATLRGPLGFAFVAAFHAALIALVAAGLQLRIAIPLPPDTQVRLIDEPRRPPPPLPTVWPVVPITVDPLIVDPELPPLDTDSSAISTQAAAPWVVESPAGSAIPQPPFVAPQVDRRHPLTQPAYPASARRLEQQGSVGLELSVRADGRVIDARVIDSSGFESLDQAAVAEARSRWRLLPARRGDDAVDGTFRIRVTFRLTDR